jgi:hypothetical protein
MTQRLKLLRKEGPVEQDQTGPQIEHDVPLPKSRSTKWGPFLERMAVGDSFLVLDGPNPRPAINRHARGHGQKFVTRMTSKGRRCWRVR